MKNDDSVFFFTLIDFLLSTLFFALVVYAMINAREITAAVKRRSTEQMEKRLVTATGVSNLAELTDVLTRLGPIREVQQTVNQVQSSGGLQNVAKLDSLVRAHGGVDSVARILAKQEGFGKPPCRYTLTESGIKHPTSIALVRADDSTISVVRSTPMFDSVLSRLGRSIEPGTALTLAEFRQLFSPLDRLEPSCKFSIDFIENTKYVAPRDAAIAGFRLNIVSRR